MTRISWSLPLSSDFTPLTSPIFAPSAPNTAAPMEISLALMADAAPPSGGVWVRPAQPWSQAARIEQAALRRRVGHCRQAAEPQRRPRQAPASRHCPAAPVPRLARLPEPSGAGAEGSADGAAVSPAAGNVSPLGAASPEPQAPLGPEAGWLPSAAGGCSWLETGNVCEAQAKATTTANAMPGAIRNLEKTIAPLQSPPKILLTFYIERLRAFCFPMLVSEARVRRFVDVKLDVIGADVSGRKVMASPDE